MNETKRCFKFAGIMLMMIFQVGFVTGMGGFFPVLQQSEVFASRCPSLDIPCDSQLEALSHSANLGFTLMAVVSLVMGALVDLYGGRLCAITLSILMGVSVMTSSFYPARGIWFSVSFCLWSVLSVGIFFSTISYHIPSLKFKSSFPLVLTNGAWDLATVVFPLLRLFWEHFAPSLFELMVGYGATMTCSTLLFLCLCFPLEAEEQQQEKVSIRLILQQLKEVSHLMRTPIFWAVVINGTITVSYTNFWISTVEQFVLWKGKDPSSVFGYVSLFGWIMPAGFCLCLIMGLTMEFSRRRNLVAVLVFQAATSAATLACALSASVPLGVTFSAVVAWRITAFCILNSSLGYIFGFRVLGRILGAVYTISGVIAIMVNHSVVEWMGVPRAHAASMWWVHMVGGTVAITAALGHALVANSCLDPNCQLFPDQAKELIMASDDRGNYHSVDNWEREP